MFTLMKFDIHEMFIYSKQIYLTSQTPVYDGTFIEDFDNTLSEIDLEHAKFSPEQRSLTSYNSSTEVINKWHFTVEWH